jgi:hypothetical protein
LLHKLFNILLFLQHKQFEKQAVKIRLRHLYNDGMRQTAGIFPPMTKWRHSVSPGRAEQAAAKRRQSKELNNKF